MTAHNGTSLNECLSLFEQFERPGPSAVFNNGSHNNIHVIQSQPLSSRNRNKTLNSHPIPSREYDVIDPEHNCMVDSAIPV